VSLLISRVVELNKECYSKEGVNYPYKDGSSDHDQIYVKECKTKKRETHISGDVNDNSCNAVKENLQKCETLAVNPKECPEYSEYRHRKRRKKHEDNRSCVSDKQHVTEESKCDRSEKRKKKHEDSRSFVSDEQYVTEETKCEELLNGDQHLVEGKDKKMSKKEGSDVKSDDISNFVVSVTRALETSGPETPVRESRENGILSSPEMGLCAETVPDDESSLLKDASVKRRRKRTRRHKKSHEPEQSKTKGKLSESAENTRRGTFIQSVASARTHIRFSERDGDVNTDSAVNDKVEAQVEFEPTSIGLSGLQPVVTSSNVYAASSEINGQELGEPNNLVSRVGSSTQWDVQALDNSQSDDLVCNESPCNNDAFAKLLAFENFSTPQVYKRKKSSATTNGTVNGSTPETLSNVDVESREQIKTYDKLTNLSQFPVLKDNPKKGDVIAFKVSFVYNTCRIIFSFL
jgi:hypothetical protein